MLKIQLKMILLILTVAMTVNVYASASAEGWQMQNTGSIYNNGSPILIRNGYLYVLLAGQYLKTPVDKYGTLGLTETINNHFINGWAGGSVATTDRLAITSGGLGINSEQPYQQSIRIINFNTDGSIDTVRISNYSVKVGRVNHASLVFNNRLYLFGGIYKDSSFNEQLASSVEFGTINSDSSIGPFALTSPFSSINGPVYLAWNSGDTIYCYGASVAYLNPRSSLERAIVLSDGTLSQWSTIQGNISFCGPTVLTKQQTLFTVQNYQTGGYNNCFKAQIEGNINSLIWGFPQHTIKPRFAYSLVSWDRFVYIIGGNNGITWDPENTAEMYDPNLTATELYEDSMMNMGVTRQITLDNF
jgi:hypothetical protein